MHELTIMHYTMDVFPFALKLCLHVCMHETDIYTLAFTRSIRSDDGIMTDNLYLRIPFKALPVRSAVMSGKS